MTVRPTFNEVKRVHGVLKTIELQSKTSLSLTIRSHGLYLIPLGTDSFYTVDLSNEKTIEAKNKSPAESPAKAAEGLKHEDLTEEDDSQSDDDEDNSEDSSEEFIKKISKSKRKLKMIERMDNVKKPKESKADFVTDLDSDSMKIFNEFYSACLTNNSKVLNELFDSHKTNEKLRVILNQRFNTNGITLLHLTSSLGHVDCIRPLLANNCDPAISDLEKSKVPYQLCARKAVRDQFRRFMNDFPVKYDYKAAQIPPGFNEESETKKRDKEKEKKRQQRKIKKEREQNFKSKQELLILENEDKRKFLSLTDAEKRTALLNDSRLKSVPTTIKQKKIVEQFKKEASAIQLNMSNELPKVLSRCWFCAENIESNTQPFEYYDFKFCSIKCLKCHRQTNKPYKN